MIHSFRFQLTLRFTCTMMLAIVAMAALTLWATRELLDREIDASLLNVASINAASVTDDPSGAMRFHEWELTPEEAASVRDLNRYAQVWSEAGQALLRTRYIIEDLPLDTVALRQAAQGEIVWSEALFQTTPIRSLYYPLVRQGQSHERHVLQVAAPLEARNRMLRQVALLLLGIVLLVTIGTFLGSWWLAERAVRPVSEIIDQAEAIEVGTLDRRIHAYAEMWEYRRLVQVLNTMLERLHVAFESQRRFTADASHELRSPLTALRGELEVARRRDRSPEEYRRVIDSALTEVERLSRLTEDLLTLARSDAGVMEPHLREIDLAAHVSHAIERLRLEAAAKRIRLMANAEDEATGLFDPDLLDRLIWNLVGNALKFSPPGSRVEVYTRSIGCDVVIEVADTGPGIREEDLPKVFERFYRADESRTIGDGATGTGLGLAIVQAIAEVHGGQVSAENSEISGAIFQVRLPRIPVE